MHLFNFCTYYFLFYNVHSISSRLINMATKEEVKEANEMVWSLTDKIDNNYYNKTDIDNIQNQTLSLIRNDMDTENTKVNEHINDQIIKIESRLNEHYRTMGKFREIQKEQEKQISNISVTLKTKAEIIELEVTNKRFDDYCSYNHLKDLYNKCMPAIKGFEDNLLDFGKEINQIKEMLGRLDEVLLTKASKVSVRDLFKELENYLLIENFETQNNKTASEIYDTVQQIQGVRDDIEEMNKQFAIEIQSSMKKIVFSLNSEMNAKMNKESVSLETVGNMISEKIDRIEFYSSLDLKSNKQDLEWTIKSIEILHKQI